MNSKLKKKLKLQTKRDHPCTMCSEGIGVTQGQYEYYSGIRVHIELCKNCAAKVIKRYVDRLLDGSEHKLAIDELSKFGQK